MKHNDFEERNYKKRQMMAEIQQPSVAIILLNWKGFDDTRACCESLTKLTYSNARVFVVDNASGDGSAETLQSEFPQFGHIANQKNLGYSGGNNAIMTELLKKDYKYILLLNNDTTVACDFIEPLVRAAEADPKIGIAGGKIYYFNSPQVIWFGGGRVDFEQLEPFKHIAEDVIDEGQLEEAGETGWITGCCLFARSEMLKHIGLLDETFGYYCEDVDWCLRAKKSGWKIWYEPQAKIWHKIGRSSGRGSLPVQYYNFRNILLIAQKNLDWPRKITFYGRAIKWIIKHPSRGTEKAGFVEAAMQGMLGRGGVLTEIGTTWWSRGIVFLQTKLRGLN